MQECIDRPSGSTPTAVAGQNRIGIEALVFDAQPIARPSQPYRLLAFGLRQENGVPAREKYSEF